MAIQRSLCSRETSIRHWEVKMLHHLEATDPDYLDRIRDGPFVPTRLYPQVTGADGKVTNEYTGEKPKSEWSDKDKENVLKDAKVRNILFNSLDSVLTNYVLSCKTAKEIWDNLKVHCEGTKPVRKNMRALLIQQYEYFEAKSGESLTDTFDRFTKLINEMAMHGKYYDLEDMNAKFMKALPDFYSEKISAIEEANDLEEISLEAVYGKLRAYELDRQQKKSRSETKMKIVALTAQTEPEKLPEKQMDQPAEKIPRKKSKDDPDSETTDIDSEDNRF